MNQNTKRTEKLTTLQLFYLLFPFSCGLLVSGCKTREMPMQFDVTKVFYRSPTEVDAAFGYPLGTTDVSPKCADMPDTFPGQFREYAYGKQKKNVMTRFFKDRLVSVTIELEEPVDDAVVAVKSFGIDPSPVIPRAVQSQATAWTAKVDGWLFKNLSALKLKSTQFDTVMFELAVLE